MLCLGVDQGLTALHCHDSTALVFKDERVQDVAVAGVKDPKDGSEQPWAFIVLRDAQDRSDESMRTILDGVNKRVAGYKKIAGATWLDALPKR